MSTDSPLAVALVSGGLDSLVAAARAKENGYRLLALSIDYNQRHQVELAAARRIEGMLGAARHVVLTLDLSAFGGSALTAEIGNALVRTHVTKSDFVCRLMLDKKNIKR